MANSSMTALNHVLLKNTTLCDTSQLCNYRFVRLSADAKSCGRFGCGVITDHGHIAQSAVNSVYSCSVLQYGRTSRQQRHTDSTRMRHKRWHGYKWFWNLQENTAVSAKALNMWHLNVEHQSNNTSTSTHRRQKNLPATQSRRDASKDNKY